MYDLILGGRRSRSLGTLMLHYIRLQLPGAMRRGVLRKYPGACTLRNSSELRCGHLIQIHERFIRGTGHEDFPSDPEDRIETLPVIGDDGCTASGRFKQ